MKPSTQSLIPPLLALFLGGGMPASSSILIDEGLIDADPGQDVSPEAGGGKVAWVTTRNGNPDVAFVNEIFTLFVLAEPGIQDQPAAHGDWVVFRYDTLGSFDIRIVSTITGIPELIDSDPSADGQPDISDDFIVFVSDRLGSEDIWSWDFATSTIVAVATTGAQERAPSIDGDLVAWEADDGVDVDIYAAHLGGPPVPFLVSDTVAAERGPDVSGALVAYEIGGDVEVFDTVTEERIRVTNDPFAQSGVQIAGDLVAWNDARNGNLDVFLYDLASDNLYPLTADAADQNLGDLTPERAVFDDDRLGNSNVWQAAFTLCERPSVIPSTNADVEGNLAQGLPFGAGSDLRVQQVYAAAEVSCPSTPREISGIAVRPDAGAGPASWTIDEIEIRLSTTQAAPGALSLAYDDNVGSDEVVVFSGTLPLSTGATGSGPFDFDIEVPFDTPFPYDPSAGNLLLDVRQVSGTQGTPPLFDAATDAPTAVSRIFGAASSQTAAAGDPLGIVTRFLFTPPPPSDTDGDGLPDVLERFACSGEFDADSDDDGLADGAEDANGDGAVDPGETDPCDADTDGDLLRDGLELGLTAGFPDPDAGGYLQGTNAVAFVPDADPTTTTSAIDPDTDDDGRLDGEEDANQNGQVDPGEMDPLVVEAPAVPIAPPAVALLAALLAAVGIRAARRRSR